MTVVEFEQWIRWYAGPATEPYLKWKDWDILTENERNEIRKVVQFLSRSKQ